MNRQPSLRMLAIVGVLSLTGNACKKKEEEKDLPTTKSGVVSKVEAATYTTQSVPGALIFELPATLVTQTSALRLKDGSGTEAEGYRRLLEKMAPLPDMIARLTENLYELDAVSEGLKTACTAANGANWQTCTTPEAVTSTFNEAVYAGVIEAVGIEVMSGELVEDMNARLDTDVNLGVITFEKLTADSSGYDECATLAIDDTHSIKFCYSGSNITAAYKDNNTTNTLTFKPSDQLVKILSETKDSEDEVLSSSFTLKQEAGNEDKHGILFNGTIEKRQRGLGGIGLFQSGIADDEGGFVDSKDVTYQANAQSIVVSGTTDAGEIYAIFPADQVVTAQDFEGQLSGFFYGSGDPTNAAQSTFSYFGPYPAPLGWKVWHWTDASGSAVVTDTGFTVTELTIPSDVFYYEEEFAGDGTVNYWTYRFGDVETADATFGESGSYTTKFRALTSRGVPLDL